MWSAVAIHDGLQQPPTLCPTWRTLTSSNDLCLVIPFVFLMKIHPYVLPGDGWLLPTTCIYINPFVFSLNTSLMKIHPYAPPGDGCFLPFVDVNTFVRWKFIPVDGWLISIPFDRCPPSQYFLMKIHSCGDCWLSPIWCVLSQWYLIQRL